MGEAASLVGAPSMGAPRPLWRLPAVALREWRAAPRALRYLLANVETFRERHGSAVWLFDYQRLRNARTIRDGLAAMDPDMHPVLAEDAIASEAAAFTVEEIASGLESARLEDLHRGFAGPIPWMQAFWSPKRSDSVPARRWREIRPPDFPTLDAFAFRVGFSERPFGRSRL